MFVKVREYTGGIAFQLGGMAAALPWVLLVIFTLWSAARLARMPR